MTAELPRYDALILAGGAGRRLGGVDKAMLEVGGRTLLERVLDAVASAERVACVGPVRATTREVGWCRESPPGGGPVAALAAGLRALSDSGPESATGRPAVVAGSAVSMPGLVVVLAVDLPFVDLETVEALVGAVGPGEGAVAVDESGRAQPLLAAYRRTALEHRLHATSPPAGSRVRDLVAGLRLRRVAVEAASIDCDTIEELAAARARLGT